MEWPQYYPESCPPKDARVDNLSVFRLVSSPITKADFLPSLREQPDRQFQDLCLACGVSVFTDKEKIAERQRRYKALRVKKIAAGTITASDGLVLETLSESHLTWWLQTEEPHRTFSEI